MSEEKAVSKAEERRAVAQRASPLESIFSGQTEGADSESYAIPFLKILQPLSPQCTQGSNDYIETAKAGMLFNTVTRQLASELVIIPVRFKREFLEWRPNRGGLCGRHAASEELVMNAPTNDRQQKFLPNGNLLQDTRQHYVLIVNKDGTFDPAMLPMSSTQIKKSRQLMNMIADAQKAKVLAGFRLTSQPEKNEKGNWFGWKIVGEGNYATSLNALNAALAFSEALNAGKVTVDESQFDAGTGGAADDSDDVPF